MLHKAIQNRWCRLALAVAATLLYAIGVNWFIVPMGLYTGGLLGFNPPFGYGIEDNDLKIIEEEAARVNFIFESYLGGMTMQEIADMLNVHKFLTRQRKPWTVWSISRLLHNPAYAGYRRWDKVEVKSHHPPIIDVGTFIRVQEMIASRVRNPKHRKVWSPPEENTG